jgi:hypothetical protein
LAFVKGVVDEEDNLDPNDIPPIKDEVSNMILDSLDIRVGRIERAELIPDPEHEMKVSTLLSVRLELPCLLRIYVVSKGCMLGYFS